MLEREAGNTTKRIHFVSNDHLTYYCLHNIMSETFQNDRIGFHNGKSEKTRRNGGKERFIKY